MGDVCCKQRLEEHTLNCLKLLHSFVYSWQVFFGKDEMNILVVYAFFVSFAVGEKDLPCRNEVDDIGIGRSIFSIFALFVAALALTPLAS